MPVLAIRHGLSEANNRENIGTLAFAAKDAPLMEIGRESARRLQESLLRDYGIVTAHTQAAASELTRAQETARWADFRGINVYSALNEVEHGMDLLDLREMLNRKSLPPAALTAARLVLEQPPTERVWITHGMLIAALCQVLGLAGEVRFIPKFCEVRELPI